MIKFTVLYPNEPAARFDMEYYIQRHMPMVRQKCAPECRRITAERGLAGGALGSRPPYIAAGHLTFDSVAAFQKAFIPHAPEILADIANYTNIQPIIQISTIEL